MGGRAAALASALLFALCHFRADTFAPLLVLGLVFGGLYLRTNNLLPAVLCHSFWNLFVLATLVLRSGAVV
jgi:membrane protease YdiL (CAAX protease family)